MTQQLPGKISCILDEISSTKAHSVHKTSVHLAILMRKDKVLATAFNRVGSRSRGCGFNEMTIHAEVNVMKRLGDNLKIKGCDLYVIRIPKESQRHKGFMNSKPCHSCEKFLIKCMKMYGLHNVYYT